jgi:hypothetical protein
MTEAVRTLADRRERGPVLRGYVRTHDFCCGLCVVVLERVCRGAVRVPHDPFLLVRPSEGKRRGRRGDKRASNASGDSSLSLAAASSMASGNPSSREQIAAMVRTCAESRVKQLVAAWARSMKRRIESDSRRAVSGTAGDEHLQQGAG